ncbi:hypothetical protein JCM10213_003382 [Rhodosporidiobolus nylandii]
MPPPRRRSSSSSFSSSDSEDEPRRRSRRRRPPSYRSKNRSLHSLDKSERRRAEGDDWPPRYEDGGTSSDSSDDSWTGSSGSSSDDSDGRSSSRSSQAPSPPSAQQASTNRCLVLFLGLAIAIFLVLLGAYALVKYFGSGGLSETSGGGDSGGDKEPQVVTVTVTASDGKVSTKVSTEAAEATKTSSAGGSSSSGSSTSAGSSDSGMAPGISKNHIGIGFLPDYTNQHMSDIIDGLGIKSSFYGWYAQLPASGDWDGSQLLSQMDDIKACNCIFQPAVMPTKGWNGLTKSDNSQALAIASVMKKFTDEGIEVWLRFAHEINWYLSDGTYQGTVEDFKEAWGLVAAAVADNDKVKMFFTPNIAASLDDYVNCFPDDTSTVHYIGYVLPLAALLYFYPKDSSQSFVEHVQPFYDKYCSEGKIKFAMGETGTMWVATIEERLAWLDQLTSAETAAKLPHYVGITWFNYDKEQDFRLWISGDSSVNDASKKWLSDGTVAEGATLGNG